jgi:hypothetical protein
MGNCLFMFMFYRSTFLTSTLARPTQQQQHESKEEEDIHVNGSYIGVDVMHNDCVDKQMLAMFSSPEVVLRSGTSSAHIWMSRHGTALLLFTCFLLLCYC